jgi:hypothetical protein
VQVNDETRQRGVEHSSEIVGTCKAHKNRGQQQQRHARKKDMVETPARHCRDDFRGLAGMHYGSRHRPSDNLDVFL